MLAKIRHVAMYTRKHAVVDRFYPSVLGTRRMTSNTLDDIGKQNSERGHISDGVIGLAILSRYAGMQSGMEHYGFEVDDIKDLVRLAASAPDSTDGKLWAGRTKRIFAAAA